jgi:hypothetical protein
MSPPVTSSMPVRQARPPAPARTAKPAARPARSATPPRAPVCSSRPGEHGSRAHGVTSDVYRAARIATPRSAWQAAAGCHVSPRMCAPDGEGFGPWTQIASMPCPVWFPLLAPGAAPLRPPLAGRLSCSVWPILMTPRLRNDVLRARSGKRGSARRSLMGAIVPAVSVGVESASRGICVLARGCATANVSPRPSAVPRRIARSGRCAVMACVATPSWKWGKTVSPRRTAAPTTASDQ